MWGGYSFLQKETREAFDLFNVLRNTDFVVVVVAAAAGIIYNNADKETTSLFNTMIIYNWISLTSLLDHIGIVEYLSPSFPQ